MIKVANLNMILLAHSISRKAPRPPRLVVAEVSAGQAPAVRLGHSEPLTPTPVPESTR